MDKFTNENIINEQISSVLNSKIDILQFPNNFCARTNDLVNYLESDEKIINENEAASLLQRVNNLFVSSLIDNSNRDITQIEFQLKKTFRENINKNILNKKEIDEYIILKMREKCQNIEDYRVLDDFITKNDKFDALMRTNRVVYNFIISHPLFKYHPLYSEINAKYSTCHLNNG